MSATTCDACGTPAAEQTPSCTSCGTLLSGPTAAPSEYEPETTTESGQGKARSCPSCGAVLETDDRYCGDCGVATPLEQSRTGPASRGWSQAPMVVLGAAVMILIATVIVFLVTTGESSNEAEGASSNRPATQGTDARSTRPDQTDVAAPVLGDEPQQDDTAPLVSDSAPTASATSPAPVSVSPASAITTDGIVIRTGPATSFAKIGSVAANQLVVVSCSTAGEFIDGPDRSTSEWDLITSNGDTGYVSGAYVSKTSVIPEC